MLKKHFKAALSLVLAMVLTFSTCANALAASNKNTYIKDVVLSYGKTADEAKAWLTENGYEILDYDLNEGADDTFSTARAVYLGYTTTDNAEEAITDMRLMNMKGGYSVQDYQMLLDEQKANIRTFLDDFIVAINEYRTNYAAGQTRAVVAHDMLNVLYDDDTQQYMGDLLLNKIKEEYTDAEWSALSEEEQAKIADMTTIIMQANADAVTTIEQTIATATDTGDTLWIDRYDSAGSYDDMLDALMEEKNLTVNEAEKQLAAEYDEDAKIIAAQFENYKTYLEKYTNSDVSFETTEEELTAYQEAHADFDLVNWFAAGTQYELISKLENDGVSLYELVTSGDYDVKGADRYMLYPLVSCLTEGQRACLDFLPMYQIVALGVNNDASAKEGAENFLTDEMKENLKTSIYDGIDRSIFSGDVALTNEALRLQAATGKNAVDTAWDHISGVSIALYASFALSLATTIGAWVMNIRMNNIYSMYSDSLFEASQSMAGVYKQVTEIAEGGATDAETAAYNAAIIKGRGAIGAGASAQRWADFFKYAGVAMTCISIVLIGLSLWSTYNDLKDYYNAEFTPIPMHMVDENENESGEKVYTYYDAVKCNRVEAGFVTDANKLLGDYGDINGDVGRQWVALYTTKDKAAGDPIKSVPVVQYESSDIPKDSSNALSMFGENSAQNLTNEQLGYTYDDDMGGIYMFYNVDENAFAGSVFSDSSYILISVAAAAVIGIAAFFAGAGVQKKKFKEA